MRLMKKISVVILFCIYGMLSFYPNPVYARRVKDVARLFFPKDISLDLLTSNEIWDAKEASVDNYRGMGYTQVEDNLRRISGLSELSIADLGFVIACLKNEAGFMQCYEKEFLRTAILPSQILPTDDIFGLLLGHLLWFYEKYRPYVEVKYGQSYIDDVAIIRKRIKGV